MVFPALQRVSLQLIWPVLRVSLTVPSLLRKYLISINENEGEFFQRLRFNFRLNSQSKSRWTWLWHSLCLFEKRHAFFFQLHKSTTGRYKFPLIKSYDGFLLWNRWYLGWFGWVAQFIYTFCSIFLWLQLCASPNVHVMH